MDNSRVVPSMTTPVSFDEEEYASQSMLLQEFSNVSNIEQAWTFKSTTGMSFGLVLYIQLCLSDSSSVLFNIILFLQIFDFAFESIQV